MRNLIYRVLSFSILLLACLGTACSDEEKEKATIITLDVEQSTVDFKGEAEVRTIAVSTNSEQWTATVDKDWCTVTPDLKANDHKLIIAVTQNKNREQRTAVITVKASGVAQKITIRQLGTDKGILVSPQIVTVKAEGETVKFEVTANVEFNITTEEWITLPIETRSAEYVTTAHTYIVQRNKGAARMGSIIVKDKTSDLSNTIVVNQKAYGAYESNESAIKGDIKVPVSGGSAVDKLGNISQVAGSGFARAYDGSKETGYHSDRAHAYPTNWPLKFTFEFKDQPRLDYCIYYRYGNECFKDVEVFVSTKETPEYTKLMDVSLPEDGAIDRIDFMKPVINPLGIRLEAKNTGGSYIIIKEMEFYRKNPDNYDPLNLFTDLTCTTLKSGITEKEINACPDPLFRNLAYYMYVGEYSMEFRAREYRAYPHPELFRKENKTSAQHDVLENPTGMFVKKGEEVVVLIGETQGYKLSARVLNLDVPGKDGFNDNFSYTLSEGINRFVSDTDGLVYIYYHTPDYKNAPLIKIHIPTGKVNGYFDSEKHTATDWNRLLNAAVGPHFDVMGRYAHLIFPVSKFKSNTPDGKALIDAYDRLVLLEQQFMGLEKYDRMDPNRVCFSVMYNDGYMYSAGQHTGYVISTMDALCDVNSLTGSSIWGPAHEVGHSYQTYPGLRWHGMTEVTNNIKSLYVQTSFGNVSRLLDKQGAYTNIYEKSMSVFFSKKRAHNLTNDEANVFNQLVPFWQLYLYQKAKGNEDFYKDLYELVRTNPDQSKPGESQVEFTVLASKAAKLDLTQFFDKWGFYEPIDYVKDDYGEKQFTVTTAMADAAKSRIAALGLSQPTECIEYISEISFERYVNAGNIVKGKAKRESQKFVMEGWRNVAAYEVYSDGKLCFVSPSSSFTVVGSLGNLIKVFAISVKGEKVEVTF